MAPTDSSMPTSARMAYGLGYLGLLPFLISALVLGNAAVFGLGSQSASLAGFYAPYVFVSYSVVILSFVSGTLWGRINPAGVDKLSSSMLLFSNVVCLSAWFSLLLTHVSQVMTLLALILLAIGYGSVLFVERFAGRDELSYWRFRRNLTIAVISLHALVLFFIGMEYL